MRLGKARQPFSASSRTEPNELRCFYEIHTRNLMPERSHSLTHSAFAGESIFGAIKVERNIFMIRPANGSMLSLLDS